LAEVVTLMMCIQVICGLSLGCDTEFFVVILVLSSQMMR